MPPKAESGGGSGGGVQVQIVKITSKVAYNHYKCSVYGSGYFDDAGSAQSSTQDSEDLWIPGVSNTLDVRTNTFMMAIRKSEHWEAIVPVWI